MPLASKAKKTTGALVTIVRRRRSASLSARAGFGWMLKELIYSSGGGLLPPPLTIGIWARPVVGVDVTRSIAPPATRSGASVTHANTVRTLR